MGRPYVDALTAFGQHRRLGGLCLGLALTLSAACAALPAVAAEPVPPAVAQWEQRLWGHSEDVQPLPERLQRLETLLFGQAAPSLPTAERVKRLQTALASSQSLADRETSPPPSASASPNRIQEPIVGQKMAAPQPGEADYPVVTAVEAQVLGQTHPREDVSLRLDRLEQQVFGKVYTGDLMTRVDRLKLRVLGDRPLTARTPSRLNDDDDPMPRPNPMPGIEDDDEDDEDAAGQRTPMSPEAMADAAGQLEQRLFHRTFVGEPMPTRLGRLEQKIFNAPAPESLSESDRLRRIAAVSQAGGERRTALSNGTMRQLLPVLLMILTLLI